MGTGTRAVTASPTTTNTKIIRRTGASARGRANNLPPITPRHKDGAAPASQELSPIHARLASGRARGLLGNKSSNSTALETRKKNGRLSR